MQDKRDHLNSRWLSELIYSLLPFKNALEAPARNFRLALSPPCFAARLRGGLTWLRAGDRGGGHSPFLLLENLSWVWGLLPCRLLGEAEKHALTMAVNGNREVSYLTAPTSESRPSELRQVFAEGGVEWGIGSRGIDRASPTNFHPGFSPTGSLMCRDAPRADCRGLG